MNERKYSYILYFIIVIIIATIALQSYWNYKNYLINKRQLITDVQTSLDQVVDDYYADLAQETTLSLNFKDDDVMDIIQDGGILDDIAKSIDRNNSSFIGLDSLKLDSIKGLKVIKGSSFTFNKNADTNKYLDLKKDSARVKRKLRFFQTDTLKIDKEFEFFASKIFISISNDSLNIKAVDSLLKANLKEKKIDINYSLKFNKPQKHKFPKKYIAKKNTDTLVPHNTIDKNALFVNSKSALLPKGSSLTLHFENANWVAFKRGFGTIFFSFVLVLAVIGCLLFMLTVIKNQKKLAEVKNDLISNITHEFKTPIATIGAAIEGIGSFNVIDDKEKTKSYLNMSSNQLNKLNAMVEKLLETATLDSEALQFSFERIDVSEMLTVLAERFATHNPNRIFTTNIKENIFLHADAFHLENIFNNILDNAIKYGGDTISVSLKTSSNQIEILISDNGKGINKTDKNQIFEKFYRVPQGNTHNVKGYGIGLYYTKTIINKHGGSIDLVLGNNLTSFKILLPNG